MIHDGGWKELYCTQLCVGIDMHIWIDSCIKLCVEVGLMGIIMKGKNVSCSLKECGPNLFISVCVWLHGGFSLFMSATLAPLFLVWILI